MPEKYSPHTQIRGAPPSLDIFTLSLDQKERKKNRRKNVHFLFGWRKNQTTFDDASETTT